MLVYLQGFNQYYIVKVMKKEFGMSPSTTKYLLKALERKGVVVRRGRFYYLYPGQLEVVVPGWGNDND